VKGERRKSLFTLLRQKKKRLANFRANQKSWQNLTKRAETQIFDSAKNQKK